MKLIVSSSISFLLAATYILGGIGKGSVLAAEMIATSQTAQNTASRLEVALKRGNVTAAVPQVEATWERQYEGYFKTNFGDRSVSEREISTTLKRIARLTGKKPL